MTTLMCTSHRCKLIRPLEELHFPFPSTPSICRRSAGRLVSVSRMSQASRASRSSVEKFPVGNLNQSMASHRVTSCWLFRKLHESFNRYNIYILYTYHFNQSPEMNIFIQKRENHISAIPKTVRTFQVKKGGLHQRFYTNLRIKTTRRTYLVS